MKDGKSGGRTPPTIPKALSNPFVPAGIVLALDILALAAAIVMDRLRDKVKVTCVMLNGVIFENSPYDMFGAAAAVLIAAAAAGAAVIIAGSLMKAKARGDALVGIASAVLLMAASAAAAGISAFVVTGEKPVNSVYGDFTDGTLRLVIAEEEYKSENLMKLYFVPAMGGEDGVECPRLLCVPLDELTEGAFQDRYKITYSDDGMLEIDFIDGVNYRTLKIPLE